MSQWSKFLKGSTLLDIATRKERFIRTIMRYAPEGSKLLEAGFGSGKMAMLLFDIGYRVTAIDTDYDLVYGEMGMIAKQFGVDVRKMDMTETYFEDQTFDVVFHQGVLEHFDDDLIIRALKENARVGKLVIFHVPNSRYRGRPFGDERLLKISCWKKLIAKSGMRIIDIIGDNPNRLFHFFLPHAFYTKTFAEKVYDIESRLVCLSTIFVAKRF